MLQELFDSGKCDEIINYFSNNKPVTQNDYSLLALSYYNLNKKNKAIGILREMLRKYPNNPDALFNLSIIYYQLKNWNKVKEFGERYFNLDSNSWEINDILSDLYVFEGNFEKALRHMELALKNVPENLFGELKIKFQMLKEKVQTAAKKPKLAFICAAGLDNFINDIIEGLSDDYWVRKFAVKTDKEIYEAIDWADIVWFEWANEVAIIGTNYPGIVGKKVIVRLHRYEAFSDFIERIKWSVVDKLILVAGSMKDVLEIYHKEKYSEFKNKIEIVYNGVKIDKFEFKERKPGFNVALVAHLHTRKNIMLALQIIDALVKINQKFKLHIAGDFQDPVLELYLKYMVKEMGLENNVIFYGWVDDMDEWWEDKNYLLSTSIHEGHPYNIMEAMARGIKPIIHNFYGARELYRNEMLFNTIEEAVSRITDSNYYSSEYREYVVNRKWDLVSQINLIKKIVNSLFLDNNNNISFIQDFKNYIEEISPFLKGDRFSNAFAFNYNKDEPLIYRLEYLRLLVKGKKVIHIGFADHKKLIEKKISNNTWLHKILVDSADVCVGIDIDRDAVEYVKSVIGIQDVYCCDITQEIPEAILNNKWDYIILGEVIEHVDNPVYFLKHISDNFKRIANKIVITAPNALKYLNFVSVKENKEVINSDHRYWFTPYTLMKVAVQAGIKIEDIIMAESYLSDNKSLDDILSKYPLFRDNIILIGNL
ncbi:glycosyltransferase [Thermovorax subterraneus]|nr:glycosyltransferase [Thermovorax subterraneus]